MEELFKLIVDELMIGKLMGALLGGLWGESVDELFD